MIIYGYDESQAELTEDEKNAAAVHEANRKRVLIAISNGRKILSHDDMLALSPQERLNFAHSGGTIQR